MKNQKFINKSFQDSDPLPEDWRNNVEKIKHMRQLSEDSSYQELLKFCIENNLFCFEYHYRYKKIVGIYLLCKEDK